MIRILFLTANPLDTTRLRLDEESRAIDEALCQSEFRDRFEFLQHWALRANDLQACLLRFKPDIVHFSGHGSSVGEIIVEDDSGHSRPVTTHALSNLFGALEVKPRCVILNACYSFEQAQAIAENVEVVVGVSCEIGDTTAIHFSTAFYRALGFGCSVQSAFDLGKSQIELADAGDENILKLIALRTNPTDLVFIREPEHPQRHRTDQHSDRNRERLLDLVSDFWVNNVLRQSLYHEVLLSLGMNVRTDATFPTLWGMVLRPLRGPDRPLPPDTRISVVFEEMHRSMLILGEPGAGKTTTMLDLARIAIHRAEKDPAEPIPVILNLASWPERSTSMAEWVTNELKTKYQIPERVSKPWLQNDNLMLLLDGLDQVKASRRPACVRAINLFLEQHLVAVAVCCRVVDYDMLDTRLNVRGAVVLQPISAEQVQHFVVAAGLQGSPLERALASSPNLQRLAQSPLMLNLMTIACRDCEELRNETQANQVNYWQERILDLYVERMLQRDTRGHEPGATEMKRWLVFLAQAMERHGQSEFLIEGLQPSWLSHRSDRWLYEIGNRLVTCSLLFGICMVAGIASLLTGQADLVGVVGSGIIVGTLFMLPHLFASIIARWVPEWAAVGLTVGLAVLVAAPFKALGGPIGGMLIGLVMALPAAFAGIRVARSDPIIFADRLTWSWRRGLAGMLIGGATTVVISLAITLNENASTSITESTNILDGITAGLFVGPAVALVLGLGRNATVPQTTRPNQRFYQSLHKAVFVAFLISAVIVGVGIAWEIANFAYTGEFELQFGLAFGLLFALPIGLSVGLAQGGIPCLQHSVLRFILGAHGYLPWNCKQFLDKAVERILLRRVGGGYTFIHSLLQDYIAHRFVF